MLKDKMSKDLNSDFKPKLSWSSPKDNIVNDFYRPALVNCRLYQRLSGYFSSTTFSAIALEILDFIQAKGQIQIITSPKLSSKDKELLEQSINKNEKILEDNFLEDLHDDPDGIKLDFFKLVGYMLSNDIDGKPQMDIKIAIPKDGGGVFHQKIGIMHYYNGEKIAFAGSVNETWGGWRENSENLTVFCSWVNDDTNRQAIVDNQRNFNDLWSNSNERIDVYDLPSAVRQKLLEISPKSEEELQSTIKKIRHITLKNKPEDSETYPESKINLMEHQHDAINKWFENDCKGLLEMATGSGKTFTAFGCVNKLQKSHPRTLTVIACPQKHLVEQWKNASKYWNEWVIDLNKMWLDFQITCNSDYPKWRDTLKNKLYDIGIPQLGSETYVQNHMVIFTTHDTLGNPDLLDNILDIPNIKKILIVDEVHNITKQKSQKVFLDEFDFRLGLSATPKRHMDDDGTQALHDYFHGIVYTLNIEAAIKRNILCPYEYIPYYVELTSEEGDEYDRLTKRIAFIEQQKQKGIMPDLQQNNPYMMRSNLVANAKNKDVKFEEILDVEFNNRLDHTLIYCTNNPSTSLMTNEPKQLRRVQNILYDRGIESKSITWEDKTEKRLDTLENMKKNHLDCITAIKCLDEGVDIPDVHTGIFMASSGNPKQFIQRRGRILRKSDATGKQFAKIYDILVIPKIIETEYHDYRLSQRKMVARELLRHKQFALIAKNQDKAIENIKNITKEFEIDFENLNDDYIHNMN